MTDTDYSTEVAEVVSALNAVYENKQANKKNSLSGDYSTDDESYPTCQAVKGAYGTRVTSWQSTPLDSNIPSEKLVKDTIDGLDADDIAYDSSNSVEDMITAYGTSIAGKASKTNGAGEITDSNAGNYNNISNDLSSSSKQSDINSALNTVIGALKGTKFIEIENRPDIPSEDTMGKLYVVTESQKVNVYYTRKITQGGTSVYSWQKLDANILDDMSDATTDTHGWMSASDKTKLNALDAMVDATQSTHGWMSTSDKFKLDTSMLKRVQMTSYDVENAGTGKIRLMASTTPDLANMSLYIADMKSLLRSQIYPTYKTKSIQMYNGSNYRDVVTFVDGSARYVTVEDFVDMGYLLLLNVNPPEVGAEKYAYCLNLQLREISDINGLQTALDGKASTSTMVNEVKVFAGQLAEAINPSS